MNAIQFKLRQFLRLIMNWSIINRWAVLILDLILCFVGYTCSVMLWSNMDAANTMTYQILWGGLYLLYNLVVFFSFKSYKGLIRHTNFQELWRVFVALIGSNVLFYLTIHLFDPDIKMRYVLTLNMLVFSLFLMMGMRLLVISAYHYIVSYSGKHSKKMLVYGIGAHSVALAQWINTNDGNQHLVKGFIVRNKKVEKTRIQDLPVYNLRTSNANWFFGKNEVTSILFPDYESVKEEQPFVTKCMERGLDVLVSPPFEGVELFRKKKNIQMKTLQFEDLLGREEIEINMEKIGQQVNDKIIMITGAAGSIGSELVRQLAGFKPELLILFDVAETPLHNLRLELLQNYPRLQFEVVVGNVRNQHKLDYVFKKYHPEVIYHAAAYKHVPLMEENPCEAVLSNILGTKNLSNFAVQYGVKCFVMISTDKAVNPTNVMGASKRVAEIYVQSLAKKHKESTNSIRFVTTRFGNVLGSNGSVIPHFKQQIEKGGPVTVTHPDIIRYFMTIPEASRLVLEAASFGESGEIYVFDMGEPVRIVDLAKRMIRMAGLDPETDIDIVFTGLRPGEKLYEELLTEKENTLPTKNNKITVASVQQYDYDAVNDQVQRMIESAWMVDIPKTIVAMKTLVPEYISQNSPFETYDRLSDQDQLNVG